MFCCWCFLVGSQNTGIPRWIFPKNVMKRWSWALCPWDHLTLVSLRMRFFGGNFSGYTARFGVPFFFWGGGCCSYLRNVGVVVIFFWGEHEPRKALNDGGFLYIRPESWDSFQPLRNIFLQNNQILSFPFFCSSIVGVFWKGGVWKSQKSVGWKIVFLGSASWFLQRMTMDGSHVFLLNDELKGLQSSVWVVRTKQFWMVINFEVDLRDEVFVAETNPFRKDVPGLLTSETAQCLRGGFTHWFSDWTWMCTFLRGMCTQVLVHSDAAQGAEPNRSKKSLCWFARYWDMTDRKCDEKRCDFSILCVLCLFGKAFSFDSPFLAVWVWKIISE